MAKTSIEWCDFSINPLFAEDRSRKARGHFCEKISPGCKNCYASRLQSRFRMHEFVASNRPLVDLGIDYDKLRQVLGRKKPTRYFWCDMTDMFMEGYRDEWRDACFATMGLTPQHVHLVLTKRPEVALPYMQRLAKSIEPLEVAARVMGHSFKFNGLDGKEHSLLPWPIPSLHFGVSVENQKYADERIPLLLQTPAAVRWVSYEPALGPVTFKFLHYDGICEIDSLSGTHGVIRPHRGENAKLDWIVCGGESGPGARPCDIQWFRDVLQQCKAAGVPCFVKQLGAHPYRDGIPASLLLTDRKGGDMAEFPPDLRVREYPK